MRIGEFPCRLCGTPVGVGGPDYDGGEKARGGNMVLSDGQFPCRIQLGAVGVGQHR
jgi:hypothetical protein